VRQGHLAVDRLVLPLVFFPKVEAAGVLAQAALASEAEYAVVAGVVRWRQRAVPTETAVRVPLASASSSTTTLSLVAAASSTHSPEG
jgi:hypothetical protein